MQPSLCGHIVIAVIDQPERWRMLGAVVYCHRFPSRGNVAAANIDTRAAQNDDVKLYFLGAENGHM